MLLFIQSSMKYSKRTWQTSRLLCCYFPRWWTGCPQRFKWPVNVFHSILVPVLTHSFSLMIYPVSDGSKNCWVALHSGLDEMALHTTDGMDECGQTVSGFPFGHIKWKTNHFYHSCFCNKLCWKWWVFLQIHDSTFSLQPFYARGSYIFAFMSVVSVLF